MRLWAGLSSPCCCTLKVDDVNEEVVANEREMTILMQALCDDSYASIMTMWDCDRVSEVADG